MEWSHQTRNEMVRTAWSCMLEGESQPSPDDRGLGPSLAEEGHSLWCDRGEGGALAQWPTLGWVNRMALCVPFSYPDQSKFMPSSLLTWNSPAASHPQQPVWSKSQAWSISPGL